MYKTSKPALCPGASGFFHGVRQPRREVKHPTLSRAEVKNDWNHTSTPPIGLYGVCGGGGLFLLRFRVLGTQKNAVGIVT